MRQLVTITKIKEVRAIPNADAIEAAMMTTNGWVCVVKKGEFQPGDLAVYFEIDSFIPSHKKKVLDERFQFLDGRFNKKMEDVEGYRLRTIKLRGQISQGLVLPVNIFPEIRSPKEGQDVSKTLHVQLYEPPQHAGNPLRPVERTRSFPNFIRKTDQERIQSFKPEEIEELYHHTFEVTAKMDGTSCTMYCNKGTFGVCSRNLELLSPVAKVGFWGGLRRWLFHLCHRWNKKHKV
jgi:RNA ligase (TIGR02306 family)